MNRRFFLLLLWAALVGLPAFAVGDENKDEKRPADLPDTTESARLAEKMPKAVSGTVFLDKKGLAGVRVTDGVEFVPTDEEGKYAITIKPDPMVPYLPSRTVSVCWPSGTWPVQQGRKGRCNEFSVPRVAPIACLSGCRRHTRQLRPACLLRLTPP